MLLFKMKLKIYINYLRFENGIKFKGGLILGANLELRKSESVEKEEKDEKLEYKKTKYKLKLGLTYNW